MAAKATDKKMLNTSKVTIEDSFTKFDDIEPGKPFIFENFIGYRLPFVVLKTEVEDGLPASAAATATPWANAVLIDSNNLNIIKTCMMTGVEVVRPCSVEHLDLSARLI